MPPFKFSTFITPNIQGAQQCVTGFTFYGLKWQLRVFIVLFQQMTFFSFSSYVLTFFSYKWLSGIFQENFIGGNHIKVNEGLCCYSPSQLKCVDLQLVWDVSTQQTVDAQLCVSINSKWVLWTLHCAVWIWRRQKTCLLQESILQWWSLLCKVWYVWGSKTQLWNWWWHHIY